MPKHLLLVDDSATMRKVVEMTFAAEDIRVTAVASADAALAAARRDRPDVILADVSMPDLSGYDLAMALRADLSLSGVPVVLLSSSQTPYDEARGRSAGVNGHILKPFETQAMIDRVKALASGARPAASAGSGARPGPGPGSGPGSGPGLGVPRPVPRAADAIRQTTALGAPPKPASPAAVLPAPPRGLDRPPMIGGKGPWAPKPAATATIAPGAAGRTALGLPEVAKAQAAPAPAPAMAVPSLFPSLGSPGTKPIGAVRSGPPPTGRGSLWGEAQAVDRVAERVAQLSARGPEYAAIARLSREVIEEIAWQVVPELAELIIKGELDRLVREKKK